LRDFQERDINDLDRMRKFFKEHPLLSISVAFFASVLAIVLLVVSLVWSPQSPQKELTDNPLEACLKANDRAVCLQRYPMDAGHDF
jgi:hypothetical protein